jgi:peptide/nickel transport system permease protein
MTAISPDIDPVDGKLAVQRARAGLTGSNGTRKSAGRLRLMLAIGWLGLLMILFVFAPLLPLHDPYLSESAAREGPSWNHPFGTDAIGRDVLARVVWGTRASLTIAVSSVVIGTIIGVALGLIAGYYRRRVQGLIVGVFDVMLSIPPLVLATALVALAGTGPDVTATRRMLLVIFAIAVVMVPISGRLARASTLAWSSRDFVHSALTIGAPHRRVILREILPNVLPSILSFSIVAVGTVLIVEGSLSLLGVGVRLPTPSWGNVIAEGQAVLSFGGVHAVFFPSLFIFLTVIALNSIGERVRSQIDTRAALL